MPVVDLKPIEFCYERLLYKQQQQQQQQQNPKKKNNQTNKQQQQHQNKQKYIGLCAPPLPESTSAIASTFSLINSEKFTHKNMAYV
jgi:hypothetical protein